MTEPEKRRPGRPPTGRTSDAARTKKSVDELKAAGGRRLNVNLSPEATAALGVVQEHHQLATATEAVETALIREAGRVTKKAKSKG